MALAMSNVPQCPNPQFSRKNFFLKSYPSSFPSSVVRFRRTFPQNKGVCCAASSAAGSSSSDSNINPYQVLGVSPIQGFDAIKAAYTRKRKDAERKGDEAAVSQLEKAYDKVMMAQLTNRKKGVTFGSFKVSKDIKYADKAPLFPWGPRFTKASVKDMRINLAISAVLTAWAAIKQNAEWRPFQLLGIVFVYRIFEKLQSSEPPVSSTFMEEGEDVEDEGRSVRMGKRLLRSLALVLSCVAVSSLGYTGLLNLIEFAGSSIPAFLYYNQELCVTASTAVVLFIMASFYR